MATAYIETTIPSYYVARSPASLFHAAKQAATREWWDGGCSGFELFTADPVITEVRCHKQEIAAAFDFDVVALGLSLQQREDRCGKL